MKFLSSFISLKPCGASTCFFSSKFHAVILKDELELSYTFMFFIFWKFLLAISSTDALHWLESHGITMLPADNSTIVASALEGGQTIALTGNLF